MPKINSNGPLGGVHIKLPFKSMDDVEFYGSYAPVADALVDTLKAHLAKQAPEEDSSTPDEDDTSEDTPEDSLLKKKLGLK